MCPIDVYYEVDVPHFGEKKLLETLNPGDKGYGLTCPQTGESKVILCDPDDNGGTIMRKQLHPQEQAGMHIVSLDAQGVPTEYVNTRDLRHDSTIPPDGTQTFRMFNAAGNSCLITCTHRSPR